MWTLAQYGLPAGLSSFPLIVDWGWPASAYTGPCLGPASGTSRRLSCWLGPGRCCLRSYPTHTNLDVQAWSVLDCPPSLVHVAGHDCHLHPVLIFISLIRNDMRDASSEFQGFLMNFYGCPIGKTMAEWPKMALETKDSNLDVFLYQEVKLYMCLISSKLCRNKLCVWLVESRCALKSFLDFIQ